MTIPFARNTHMSASEPGGVQIHLRATDPFWYSDDIQTYTENITSGSGSMVIGSAGGFLPTSRVTIRIKKTTADNPTDVTVTNVAAEQIAMDGTITTSNEYWFIDCHTGQCRKGTNTASEVDAMGEFGGDFINIANNVELLTIGEAGTSDFEVRAKFLRRMM